MRREYLGHPARFGLDVHRSPVRADPLFEVAHLRVEVFASGSARLVVRVPHGAHRRVDDPTLEQYDDPDEQQRRPDIAEYARDVAGAIRIRHDCPAGRDRGEAEHDAPRDPRPPDARAGRRIHPFSVRLAC